MKRQISPISFAFALGVLAVLGTASVAFADDHRCTLHNVAGAYGYTVTGIRNGIGPAASMGIAVLDDDGTVSGSQSASFNGIILTETFAGTFTVNDDCSGSTVLNVVSSNPVFNRTSNLDLVWDDGEARFRMIFTDANTILTGDGQRTH
jgi:hypothetical protein